MSTRNLVSFPSLFSLLNGEMRKFNVKFVGEEDILILLRLGCVWKS